MTNPILEVISLSVKHKHARKRLLMDISFKVHTAEIMSLVGESGAGKSMITKVILGILPRALELEHGQLNYEGSALNTLTDTQRRHLLAKDIAMIPQDPLTAMNPLRRVRYQAIDSILALKLPPKKSYAYLCHILEKVKIRDPERVMNSYPHQLSGGMRQRILIACAFAKKPKLIIADEPTTALDVTVQKEVLWLIKQMQNDHHTAMLFITHDLGVVANIADQVCVLFSGQILEQGPVKQIIRSPQHEYTKALIETSPQYHLQHLPDPIDDQLLHQLQIENDQLNIQLDKRYDHPEH